MLLITSLKLLVGQNGYTSLLHAAEGGFLELSQLLLEHNADVNASLKVDKARLKFNDARAKELLEGLLRAQCSEHCLMFSRLIKFARNCCYSSQCLPKW